MEGLSFSHSPVMQSVSLSEIMRPRFSGGKIALPVDNFSPFIGLKHVQGVPSNDGPGYSISKLKILDSLIDRLVKLKDKKLTSNVPESTQGLSDQALDAMINDLAKKLQVAATQTPVGTAEALGPSFGMAQSQTGAVLSVLA